MTKKKNNKNLDDLMAKLGASLKESPIAAHQRQGKAKAPTAKKTKTSTTNQSNSAAAQTLSEKPKNNNQEYQRLQSIVKKQTQPEKKTNTPSYRGWKTSTVGLYPEDYQKAREAMNYIQDQTGENTNLSRIIKIALRSLEIGPTLIDINNEIKNKDGRLVSRRQNIVE